MSLNKYFINKMMVYVNHGLGMSIAPVRYNATPEITVIKLTRKSTKD